MEQQRPLGVAAMEDEDCPDMSSLPSSTRSTRKTIPALGTVFPGRSQHQALDALSYALLKKRSTTYLMPTFEDFSMRPRQKVGWSSSWRTSRRPDPRILRLIQKWLDAGVRWRKGKWSDSANRSPQG